MTMFMSTISGKIDAKGRVSVPSVFRSAISAQNGAAQSGASQGIFVYPSFTENAIEGGGHTLMMSSQRATNSSSVATPSNPDDCARVVDSGLLSIDTQQTRAPDASAAHPIGVPIAPGLISPTTGLSVVTDYGLHTVLESSANGLVHGRRNSCINLLEQLPA